MKLSVFDSDLPSDTRSTGQRDKARKRVGPDVKGLAEMSGNNVKRSSPKGGDVVLLYPSMRIHELCGRKEGLELVNCLVLRLEDNGSKMSSQSRQDSSCQCSVPIIIFE